MKFTQVPPSLYTTEKLINEQLAHLAYERQSWLNIGIALYNTYGNNRHEAFNVWFSWSGNSSRHTLTPKEAKNQWKTFHKLSNNYGYIINQVGKEAFIAFLKANKNDDHASPYQPPKITPAQQLAQQKEKERLRQQQEKEAAQRCQTTLQHIHTQTGELHTAPINHPYLQSKDIVTEIPKLWVSKHKIMLLNEHYIPSNALIFPIHSIKTGAITSYQHISATGEKWIIKNTVIKESAFILEGHNQQVILCEGLATAYTINQATCITTYCCINAANIKSVALALIKQGRDPKSLYLAYDNDAHKDHWAQILARYQEIEKTLGIHLFIPSFIPGKKGADWNDHGINTCNKAFNALNLPTLKKDGRYHFHRQYIDNLPWVITHKDKAVLAVLKSDMATGKTYSIKLFIDQYHLTYNQLPNIVYIAPLTKLNKQMALEISEYVRQQYGFKNEYMTFYKTIKKEKNNEVAGEMAICCSTTMQSTNAVFQHLNQTIDLLVIDESESVAESLTSKEVVTNYVGVAESLRKIGGYSTHVLLFDANAGDATLKLAKQFKPHCEPVVYENDYRSMQGFKAVIIMADKPKDSLDIMKDMVIQRYKHKQVNEVIPVFFMSKTAQLDIANRIHTLYPEARILIANDQTSIEFEAVLANKTTIKEYDYILYTSAAGTGVSFDQTNLFTETYCVLRNNYRTPNIKTVLQGSLRIRHPKNNTIYFNATDDMAVIDQHKENERILKDTQGFLYSLGLSSEARRKVLEGETDYVHGEHQQFLVELFNITRAEYHADKKDFTNRLINPLKNNGVMIELADIQGWERDEAAGLAAKEARAKMKEIENRVLIDNKHLSDNQYRELKIKKTDDITTAYEDIVRVLKYKILRAAQIKPNDYDTLSDHEKRHLKTLYKKGLVEKIENIEAANNTLKQNRDIVNYLIHETNQSPFLHQSRFLRVSNLAKKAQKLADKGEFNSSELSNRRNKEWATRNTEGLTIFDIPCTPTQIKNNIELIMKKMVEKFGYEIVTIKQTRLGKGKNRSKKTNRIIKVQKINAIVETVTRYKQAKQTINDRYQSVKKNAKHLIISGGTGTTWTPIIIDKRQYQRPSANILINKKSKAIQQIWITQEEALQPNLPPKNIN